MEVFRIHEVFLSSNGIFLGFFWTSAREFFSGDFPSHPKPDDINRRCMKQTLILKTT
jgi:hypothetical protein